MSLVNKPVKLIMTSRDVLHSFYIPTFRIKQDVVPGMYTSLWFKANRRGEISGFLCGILRDRPFSHAGQSECGSLWRSGRPGWKTIPIRV